MHLLPSDFSYNPRCLSACHYRLNNSRHAETWNLLECDNPSHTIQSTVTKKRAVFIFIRSKSCLMIIESGWKGREWKVYSLISSRFEVSCKLIFLDVQRMTEDFLRETLKRRPELCVIGNKVGSNETLALDQTETDTHRYQSSPFS